MTYVILGAGAVGSALAAEFTLAGIPNLLVGRGAQLDHLRGAGLTYRRPGGTRQVDLSVTDLASLTLSPSDILLLAVKTQDVEDLTARLVQIPLAADLPLFTLQNGLEAERLAARRFARTYAAVVRTPAIYTETGKVKVLADPYFASFSVGRWPSGRDAVTGRLAADLSRAGGLVEEHDDIPRWKAQKLTYNVRNVVELFAGPDEEASRIADALTAEAKSVLTQAGLDPATEADRKVPLDGWKITRDPVDPGGQSTWQSFVRGARSEVDFLNGEIVLQARLLGRTAPWNRAAQTLAASLASAGGKPGDIGLDRLAALAQVFETAAE